MGYDYTFHKQNLPGDAWRGYNELKAAIRCKDLDSIKRHIDNGASLNGHSDRHYEFSPLHLAVISRCPKIIKILLDNGANVNTLDVNQISPLVMAAKMENPVVVDLLLSYDVQVCRYHRDDLNHLHIACMRNKLEVVKKLVSMSNGETVNKPVKQTSVFWPGFTALHFAVYYGCTETVEYLLRCGVNIMAEDSKQMTPLHWADVQRNEEIIDLLLAAHRYEFKNPVSKLGLSHFHIACTRNDAAIVEHFLKLGVNINLEVIPKHGGGWYNWKPIWFATYYECPKVIMLLLKVKVDSKFKRDMNLLKYAFLTGNRTIYDVFIAEKMKSSRRDQKIEKISRFQSACINDDVGTMELNHYRFDINWLIWSGCTTLHIAAKYNSVNATNFLLARGADVTIRDSLGKTPLHVAFERNHLKIVEAIAEHFTDRTENVSDDVGLSFLHILCSTGKLNEIERILLKKVDVNAKVSDESLYWAGFTPMQFACKFEQTGVVKLLFKYNADIFIKNGSISDHFADVFDDFGCTSELQGFRKVPFEHLMMVFSSQEIQSRYSNEGRVSPLHALCHDAHNPDADPKVLKQYLTTHKNEINQTIEMPQLREFHKCTPLHFAVRYHEFAKAKLVVDAGADLQVVNEAGNTPVEGCFLYGGPMEFISDSEAKSLFPVGTPIDNLKPSHFFIACGGYLFKFVTYVLNNVDQKLKKSFVDCRSDIDRTPLHLLARQTFLEPKEAVSRKSVMLLLLKNGADVDAKDYELRTPLHHVDQEEVALLLLANGADVNFQNIFGETPLHVICLDLERFTESLIDHKVIIALLENGADINIEDRIGRTCLMIVESRFQYHDTPIMKERVITLLKHVKKLQLIGIYINEKNITAYRRLLGYRIFNESIFVDECKKELEQMRHKNIDHHSTVHSILLKSSNEMTSYCENNTLLSIFESKSKDFPIYSSLVRLQMKRGRIRKLLLNDSKRSLTFLSGRFLPDLCSESILAHLSDIELKSIIACVEN